MIIPAPKQLKVLLIGDTCKDVYEYGTVERISPEAPVPIFKKLSSETKVGMVSNVKANLENLGVETILLSGKPSIKTRLVDSRSKQHIVRIDNDVKEQPLKVENIDGSIFTEPIHGIVISDYNKGFVDYELIEKLRKLFIGPIFLDTKKTDLVRFNGIFVKINELEYNNKVSSNDKLIVTLGDSGAMYKTLNETKHYSIPKIDVTDVCGAGDTFLAAFAFAYMQSNNVDTAIDFANRAAMVTVQHFGNYAPTLKEIV